MPQAALHNPGDLVARLERHARAGMPKYVALRDAVVEAVTSGTWPAGMRLPTESEWAAQLPIALGTIQRALRMLVEEGVIVRRQGQGSFVAERHVGRMHAPLHCRFVDDSGEAYLPVYPEVVARVTDASPGPWSLHLGTSGPLRIERVLRIADEFRVYSRFWADPERLPALASLSEKKLSGENFKEIIWRELRQPVGRISQFLSMATIPAEVCAHVGVKRGTRGQFLEVSAFTGRGSPIYYQELWIPPNGRRLHLAVDDKDPGLGEAG